MTYAMLGDLDRGTLSVLLGLPDGDEHSHHTLWAWHETLSTMARSLPIRLSPRPRIEMTGADLRRWRQDLGLTSLRPPWLGA
jgi:hypothetical protein